MLDLLRWVFVVLGVTYMITESLIFAAVRGFVIGFIGRPGSNLVAFVYCPPCVAFWIGFGAGALGLWPFHENYFWLEWLESAFAAMAVGAIYKTQWSNVDHAFNVEFPAAMEGRKNALAQKTSAQDERDDDDESEHRDGDA